MGKKLSEQKCTKNTEDCNMEYTKLGLAYNYTQGGILSRDIVGVGWG